jgi:hypothetical protein
MAKICKILKNGKMINSARQICRLEKRKNFRQVGLQIRNENEKRKPRFFSHLGGRRERRLSAVQKMPARAVKPNLPAGKFFSVKKSNISLDF